MFCGLKRKYLQKQVNNLVKLFEVENVLFNSLECLYASVLPESSVHDCFMLTKNAE